MRPSSVADAGCPLPVSGRGAADRRWPSDDRGGADRAGSGRRRGSTADLDLGNVAIVPGFVERAYAPGALGARADDRVAAGPGPSRPKTRSAGCAGSSGSGEGVRRSRCGRRSGGTSRRASRRGRPLVADTTTAGLSWDAVAAAPVRGGRLRRADRPEPRRAGSRRAKTAWDWLATIRPEAQAVASARPGLSPHAPYSTAGWLYHKAAASRLPLSTHLAEMPEELQLLERRDGPLRTFLEELGAWDDDWEPIGPRPADYVRRGELRNADWLIAHGTYFDPSEFWQLRPEAAPDGIGSRSPSARGRTPGSATPPTRTVPCSSAASSSASGPTAWRRARRLSLLDEIRFLHRRDPSLGGPLLLTMATLFGAWALRARPRRGSLKAGKSADLALIALPDRDEPDPHALLLESDLPVVGTVFEGEFVSGRRAGTS